MKYLWVISSVMIHNRGMGWGGDPPHVRLFPNTYGMTPPYFLTLTYIDPPYRNSAGHFYGFVINDTDLKSGLCLYLMIFPALCQYDELSFFPQISILCSHVVHIYIYIHPAVQGKEENIKTQKKIEVNMIIEK